MASTSSVPTESAAPQQRLHPLALLGADEIRAASSILFKTLQGLDTLRKAVHIKNISLHDPPKALLLPHLDAEAAGVPYDQRPYVPRCVDIIWATKDQRNLTESTVSLDTKTVVKEIQAGKGQYGPNDR